MLCDSPSTKHLQAQAFWGQWQVDLCEVEARANLIYIVSSELAGLCSKSVSQNGFGSLLRECRV